MSQTLRPFNCYKLTNGKMIETTLGIIELNEILSRITYGFSTLRKIAEERGHKIKEVRNEI